MQALPQLRRSGEILTARSEVIKEQAELKIQFGMSHGGGPKEVESSKVVRFLRPGTMLWGWRRDSKMYVNILALV